MSPVAGWPWVPKAMGGKPRHGAPAGGSGQPPFSWVLELEWKEAVWREQPVMLRASASRRYPAERMPHVLPQPAAQPTHTSLVADVLGLVSETALTGFLIPYPGP